MSRATEELLDLLHGTLAQSLVKEIQTYKKNKEPIPPALLGQVIKFLKDNGVTAPLSKGSPLDTLSSELSDIELEDDSAYTH